MPYVLTQKTILSLCAGIALVLSSISILTPSAHAQMPVLGEASISLDMQPETPAPKSTVTLSVNDYSVDTIGATIRWFVDGVEQAAQQNERSLQVTLGVLGKTTTVRVTVTKPGLPTLSHTRTITPRVIDLIVEGDTYTPLFYTGRVLPSKQSSFRAIALVHDTKGSIKNTYSYKWSLGSTVLFGGPVKGKYMIEEKLPTFGDAKLGVEVFDTEGTPIGSQDISIVPADIELYFYEYSLLRGLSERAVQDPHALIGDEVTLFGEPYYLNANMREQEVVFDWQVDGNTVATEPDSPHAITLRKNTTSGQSLVSLDIITRTAIPQYVQKSLKIAF